MEWWVTSGVVSLLLLLGRDAEAEEDVQAGPGSRTHVALPPVGAGVSQGELLYDCETHTCLDLSDCFTREVDGEPIDFCREVPLSACDKLGLSFDCFVDEDEFLGQ